MIRRTVINKFKHDVDNVNVGVAVSFDGHGIFKSTTTTTEQLKSNLIDLIMTNKGERFFDYNYGCNLNRLLFEPITDGLDVESLIMGQVSTYIPQLEITKITTDKSYNDYKIVIKLEYKIIHTSVTDVVNIAI